MRETLTTERLMLRPFVPEDAERMYEVCSNPKVARMLRLMPWPYSVELARAWIESHGPERARGEGYRFAVWHDGVLIGCADVDEIAGGEGEIGYWVDEPYWGRGFAPEAARAVIDFAFGELDLDRLKSGHAADNHASARVHAKLGFVHVGDTNKWSNPRGEEIVQKSYVLARADWKAV